MVILYSKMQKSVPHVVVPSFFDDRENSHFNIRCVRTLLESLIWLTPSVIIPLSKEFPVQNFCSPINKLGSATLSVYLHSKFALKGFHSNRQSFLIVLPFWLRPRSPEQNLVRRCCGSFTNVITLMPAIWTPFIWPFSHMCTRTRSYSARRASRVFWIVLTIIVKYKCVSTPVHEGSFCSNALARERRRKGEMKLGCCI